EDACLLTAGVDVQDNRLELELVAWNQYEDTYSIKYHVIPGSPEQKNTWDKLDLILFHSLNKNRRTFEHSLSKNVALPVLATCIDMGGHATQHVLNYCAQRVGLNVWAINGVGGQGKPVWPRKVSKGKYKIPFYSIGVDTAKETIYNRLKNETSNTGCCWFPLDREEKYFKQLTSEEVVEKPSRNGPPKRIWDLKAGHKRNEPLDCRVYAYAALEGLKLHGLVLSEAYRKIVERAGRN
ncbi:MAG: phage terminase large subunit family protein, partial [Candidatus Pacebacteria bacterium]|nr:phage terminase large subunit family protein [Candidatus Paceibacterota bacterium]